MTTLTGIVHSVDGVLNGERVVVEIDVTIGGATVTTANSLAGAEFTTSLTSTAIRLKKTDGTVLAPPPNTALSVKFSSLQRFEGIDQRLISASYSNALFGEGAACYVTAWEKVGNAVVNAPPPPSPPAGTPGGLLARYYNNQDFVGQPVYTATEVPFIEIPRDSTPRPGVTDDFSARFTGFIRVPEEGKWRLGFDADDKVRVYVNGQLVVDRWFFSPDRVYTQYLDAEVDVDYPLWIEFADSGAGATLRCYWQKLSDSGAPGPEELLPAGNLYASIPDNLPVVSIPIQGRHYVTTVNRY